MQPARARRRRRPPARRARRERYRLRRDLGRVFRRLRGIRLLLPSLTPMETVIFGLIALALLVYLVVAVLRPEWF